MIRGHLTAQKRNKQEECVIIKQTTSRASTNISEMHTVGMWRLLSVPDVRRHLPTKLILKNTKRKSARGEG